MARRKGELEVLVGPGGTSFLLEKPALKLVSGWWQSELATAPDLQQARFSKYDAEDFRVFLQHLFPKEEGSLTAEQAAAVGRIANDWQIPHLLVECELRLLKEPPCHALLELAIQTGMTRLRKRQQLELGLEPLLIPEDASENLAGMSDTARQILNARNERDCIEMAAERRAMPVQRRVGRPPGKCTDARVTWRRARLEQDDPTLLEPERLHMRVTDERWPVTYSQ
mmetsp:Transcript_73869/g.196825  ORF Transcript_73869/g.196825 Transcript_73869/m.196825 type:complete len:226 (-) Transcript_73869:67-744(-)